MAPSRTGDKEFRRSYGWLERLSQNPATVLATLGWLEDLDLRTVLPTIRVPTLVLHREAGQTPQLDQGRYLADHIAGARLVVVPGTDYEFISEHPDEIVDHIEEFITGVPPLREPDRALATVLFTDFVASTEHAARMGDKKWATILDQHDVLVRRELDRHRGRKINTTGDGVLATFDGPARAVRCAQAIIDAMQALGVEVRAGLHTGEVELRGDDIGGIAVHIGQRVSALAGPGEVLVSRTITDLVASSGLEFEDRGEHELKGVSGEVGDLFGRVVMDGPETKSATHEGLIVPGELQGVSD
jgi:class 3 adenylate cyclase